MKKGLILLFVSLFLLVSCQQKVEEKPSMTDDNTKMMSEKPSVVTTIYPITFLTEKIVGDLMDVKQLLPVGGDGHHWEPTAKEIGDISKASLFIYNGAGMEGYVEDVLETLKDASVVAVEASKGVELLEGHHHHDHEEEHMDHDHDKEQMEHDHDKEHMEHDHDKEHMDHDHHHHVDPHTFNTPKNLLILAENIYQHVLQADKSNQATYEKNYAALKAELETIGKEYDNALSKVTQKQFVVSHEAFGYLAHQYGLEQLGVEGLNPHSEPSPAKVAEIIEHIKEHQIKVVFFENDATSKVAETIATEAKVKVDVLYPLASLTQEAVDAKEDLFSLLRKNLSSLENALK